jgi:hypothetical protein
VSGLLPGVDSLFRTAVMSPNALTDQAITDWYDGIAATADLDRQSAKLIRRLIRTAQKLAAFWSDDARVEDIGLGWRARVDIAMGPRAWRPVLEIGQYNFETHPSEETFESVGDLFRMVNGEAWMDGMTYGEWLEESKRI